MFLSVHGQRTQLKEEILFFCLYFTAGLFSIPEKEKYFSSPLTTLTFYFWNLPLYSKLFPHFLPFSHKPMVCFSLLSFKSLIKFLCNALSSFYLFFSLLFYFLAASLLWACIWIPLSYTQPWHCFPNWVLPTLLKSSSELHKRFFTCVCGIRQRARPPRSAAFKYWSGHVLQWIWRRRLFTFSGIWSGSSESNPPTAL